MLPAHALKFTFPTLLMLAGASQAEAASAELDPVGLQPLDVFGLEWADAPRVAPDARAIAYVRGGSDIMSDRSTSRIWLVDPDGDNHRPLTDRSGFSPRWSPDGKRIAFLSRGDQGVEIAMHWRADNRTAHITQLPETPSNLEFSPDGRWLAFTMFKPTSVKPMTEGPEPPKGAEWAPQFKVFETVQYRADGAGYLRAGFNHLYVVPADGGSPRQITRDNFHHGDFAWAEDGQSLYVSANRDNDWAYQPVNTELYQVDLTTGTATGLTDRYGPDGQPAVSPNGRFLAYVGYDDAHRGYENANLYLRNLSSGETTNLSADLDRSVTGPIWSADSRSIYVQYDDQGRGVIASIDRLGKRKVVAADLGGTAISRPYTGGAFHIAGGLTAYTRGSATQPADLAVMRGSKKTVLTELNGDLLAHKSLAPIETIRFPSSLDGQEIEAWIARPPDFDPDQTYPLILEIHGGPFAAYGPQFSAEVQLYAAAGYIVVYVNPRGSTSYGAAFANQIHHAYPGGDFDDLMSAVDHAIELGSVDEERLYVTGGSGGGILTAWIVTHTDRFRAAVSAKPVINWYSFVLTADSYVFFQRYWFDKPPWEDPESYLNRSPLHFVDQVTTPTMLLTGEDDHRTPISESEQFYQALKINKVDTALVRIPEASHGITARPSHLIGKVQHVLAWFERYAGD